MTFIPSASGKIDSNNTTNTTLESDQTFTGISTDVSGFESVVINVYADQNSSLNGLNMQFSTDDQTWQTFIALTIPANNFVTKSIPIIAKYFRIIYQNDSVEQTVFRLQTALKLSGSVQIENCSIVSVCNSPIYSAGQTGFELAGNTSWIGTWEDISQSAQIITNFRSTQASEFQLEFSTNGFGTDNDRIYGPYVLAANTDCNQMFAPVRKYFRIKFSNTSGSTAIVSVEIRLLSSTSILYNNLTDVMDINTSCMSNRAVPFGINDSGRNYTQISATSNGYMKVAVAEPVSAFGDMLMVNPYPMAQIDFVYNNINHNIVSCVSSGAGATGSASNQMLSLVSGTTAGSNSTMQSIRQLLYKPGQGGMARYSAMFEQGITDTQQIAGIGNTANGYFFGYNQSSFGILYRRGGVDVWIPQTNWNVDCMDGTFNQTYSAGVIGATGQNKSGVLLDPTKGNVYQIKYQYLGFGVIKFYVETPMNTGFICVHTINYPNTYNQPNLTNPSMPLYFQAMTVSGSTSVTLKTASGALFLEGKPEFLGPKYGLDGNITISGSTSATVHNIVALQCTPTFNSLTNWGQIRLRNISVSCANSSKNSDNGVVVLQVIKNPTGYQALSYTSVDGNNSIAASNNSTDSISGGDVVFNTSIASNGNQYADVTDLFIFLNAGDVLCFCAKSTIGAIVSVSFCWSEEI